MMKMKKIKKCIKIQSVKLDIDTFDDIDNLFQKYKKCRNDFYQQYSGIKSMLKIENSKTLRNEIRENNKNNPLEKKYQFQNRHWIMALFDVCSNIKSSWSNLSNKLKTKIKENENLNNEEKSYLYYIVSVKELWFQLLNNEDLNIKNMKTFNKLKLNIDDSRFHYLHNYLKRITRKYKPKIPYSEINNCISLDQEMYKIIEENDNTFISFASDVTGKRFKIKLKSKYCYSKSGNIQLILNRNKKCVEIHKVIESKTKENRNTATIGIDKGYSTLLSCSDDKEYGIDMGKQFTKMSDFINKRNTNRNYFIQKHKELKQKLKEISFSILNEKDELKQYQLLLQKIKLLEQISHIEQYNLGNKLYQKQHKRNISTLERDTNFYIKQMFKESNVYSFSKEDLSFTKTKNKGKKCNRILNSWLKGTLNERLEYLALYNNISFVDVNPAYTSQYCYKCQSKIERKGQHHEIAICPKCGKLNANTNAAKNILSRKYDTRITLKTSCKKVQEILEQN